MPLKLVSPVFFFFLNYRQCSSNIFEGLIMAHMINLNHN